MADDESNQRRKVKFLQILLLMDSFEEEDVLRSCERVIWTRSWIRRREERGAHHQLIRELAIEDAPAFTSVRNVGTSSTGFATTERTRRKLGIGRITEESLVVTSKSRRLGKHLKATTGKRKKMTNHGVRWGGTHHSVTNKLVIFYEGTIRPRPQSAGEFASKPNSLCCVFKLFWHSVEAASLLDRWN